MNQTMNDIDRLMHRLALMFAARLALNMMLMRVLTKYLVLCLMLDDYNLNKVAIYSCYC